MKPISILKMAFERTKQLDKQLLQTKHHGPEISNGNLNMYNYYEHGLTEAKEKKSAPGWQIALLDAEIEFRTAVNKWIIEYNFLLKTLHSNFEETKNINLLDKYSIYKIEQEEYLDNGTVNVLKNTLVSLMQTIENLVFRYEIEGNIDVHPDSPTFKNTSHAVSLPELTGEKRRARKVMKFKNEEFALSKQQHAIVSVLIDAYNSKCGPLTESAILSRAKIVGRLFKDIFRCDASRRHADENARIRSAFLRETKKAGISLPVYELNL